MSSDPKAQVVALLKSIETGEAAPVAVVNPAKYIQHNLAVGDGLAGFGAVLQALPKGSAKVNTVRVFQDGEFVFAESTSSDLMPPVRSSNTGTTCRRRRPSPTRAVAR